MRLATLPAAGRDGALVLVSGDLKRAVSASAVAATLREALERWAEVEPVLRRLAETLEAGGGDSFAFDPAAAAAPLPRTWQWLDGSAFASHGELMQLAYKLPPIETDGPLMYQGLSHEFLGPSADVPLPSEADGIDFEGEFGIVTDDVPMGVTPGEALSHIRLVVQINDWSLRNIGAAEMKTGFGWVQGKPACSMAPVALTPDELGDSWRDGRVCLPLQVWRNDERFGAPEGGAMAVGFGELIAHAARTRSLCAGTVIGSGTVSNASAAEVGSACIAERRALDTIATGAPQTQFLSFGERVRMECAQLDGRPLFGPIDQLVVQANAGQGAAHVGSRGY